MIKQATIEIDPIQAQNASQSYLFNLIVYSTCQTRTLELKQILGHVTEKFPCRIIQIEKLCAPDANEIKVTMSKEKYGKTSQISCDILKIVVSDSQLERVPFIIMPNIVADLPVYLIWGDDPTYATKTLTSLQSFSSRLIFNATWSDNLQDFSTRMLPFLKSLKIDCMDISWALLSAWKELLVQVFDTEEKIHHLQTCKKIKIAYRYEKPQDKILAIYLQGFIASRLGWELEAQEIEHNHQKALCYRYLDKDINVVLEPIHQVEAKPGSIIHFELWAQDGTVYTLNTLKSPTKALLHISSDEKCEMPCAFALSDINRGFSFLREVFYQTPGDHYADMLAIISKVDWEK